MDLLIATILRGHPDLAVANDAQRRTTLYFGAFLSAFRGKLKL
jgi:hypothetical protein